MSSIGRASVAPTPLRKHVRRPRSAPLWRSTKAVRSGLAFSGQGWISPAVAPISDHDTPLFPPDLSRTPDAARPSRTAGPTSRHRARTGGRGIRPSRPREAPEADEATSSCSSRKTTLSAFAERSPRGHRAASMPTPRSARKAQAALTGVGAANAAVDDVFSGAAEQCLRRLPSARPSRRERPRPWAFACSTTSRSPPAMRRRRMAPSASRSSTGTCTTATAPRTFSGTIRRCSTAPRTRCRFIPAPAPRRNRRGQHRQRAALAAVGSELFREAFRSRVLPALTNFRPDLIIISAGFDAHYRDPLAEINLVEEDFDWATGQLMERADAHRRQPPGQPARRRL